MQLCAVLDQFPDEVIRYVSNPVTGIQNRSKFPPTIAEVVAACEEFKTYLENQRERLKAKTQLGDFEAVMRQHVSEENFWSWFSQMRLVHLSGDQVTLAVRSGWFATEIRKRFEKQILEAANAQSLRLEVDKSLQHVNRGPAPFDKDGNRR